MCGRFRRDGHLNFATAAHVNAVLKCHLVLQGRSGTLVLNITLSLPILCFLYDYTRFYIFIFLY